MTRLADVPDVPDAPDRPVVLAVVPTFDAGDGLADLVRSLMAQTHGRVVVVDDTGGAFGPAPADGSPSPAQRVVEQVVALGAQAAWNPVNLGIGAALTSGIHLGRQCWPEVTAVITVDQDSQLADDHVERLLAALAHAERAGVRVGLVGPEVVEGVPSRAGRRLGDVRLSREPLQSGLLVPLAVLDAVGGLDTTLVIDGVDSDLWLRVLDSGARSIVAPGLRVGHRLGAASPLVVAGHPVTVGGKPLQVPVSAPFRSYYLVRNRLRLVGRHGRRHPVWALAQLVGLARHLALTLLLDRDARPERLRAVGAGLRDALLRRAGVRR